MKLVAIATVALLSASGSVASAALLAYEGFDYARRDWTQGAGDPAGVGVAGLAGGSGWSGGWTDVNTTILPGIANDPADFTVARGGARVPFVYLDGSGNTLVEAGGQFRSGFGNASTSTRNFAAPLGGEGQTVYLSFLAQRHNASTNYSLFQLNGAGDVVRFGKISADTTNNNWGVQTSTVATAYTSSAVDSTTMTLFFARLDFAAAGSTVSLWFNPSLEAGADLGAPAIVRSFAGTSFTGLTLQTRSSTDFDEIRFGDTVASVLPVPEPGAAMLLAVAAPLLASRRR